LSHLNNSFLFQVAPARVPTGGTIRLVGGGSSSLSGSLLPFPLGLFDKRNARPYSGVVELIWPWGDFSVIEHLAIVQQQTLLPEKFPTKGTGPHLELLCSIKLPRAPSSQQGTRGSMKLASRRPRYHSLRLVFARPSLR
jgi:hypothetical protein